MHIFLILFKLRKGCYSRVLWKLNYYNTNAKNSNSFILVNSGLNSPLSSRCFHATSYWQLYLVTECFIYLVRPHSRDTDKHNVNETTFVTIPMLHHTTYLLTPGKQIQPLNCHYFSSHLLIAHPLQTTWSTLSNTQQIKSLCSGKHFNGFPGECLCLWGEKWQCLEMIWLSPWCGGTTSI